MNTNIDIISGFLGAGKTTLIKKLLDEALKHEKVILIENEFGEIGIDRHFLEESGIEIKEMNSGCICCSLVGDFETSLRMVLEQYHPDRIIIEPSGVGKLSDVINAINRVPEAHLHSAMTVVDAKKCSVYMKNFGEFFNNQIQYASAIVLSHTQALDESQLLACCDQLRSLNPASPILTTPWDQLKADTILDLMNHAKDIEIQWLDDHHDHHEGECCHHDHHHEDGCCHHEHHHEGECHHHDHHHEDGCCHHEHHHEGECCHHEHDHEDGCCHHGHHHEHHHADEVFTSWAKESPKTYDEDTLAKILEQLSKQNDMGIILRAKGIVPSTQEDWLYFDMIPGEYEIRHGKPDYTGRIVVIGSHLDEEKIDHLFK